MCEPRREATAELGSAPRIISEEIIVSRHPGSLYRLVYSLVSLASNRDIECPDFPWIPSVEYRTVNYRFRWENNYSRINYREASEIADTVRGPLSERSPPTVHVYL